MNINKARKTDVDDDEFQFEDMFTSSSPTFITADSLSAQFQIDLQDATEEDIGAEDDISDTEVDEEEEEEGGEEITIPTTPEEVALANSFKESIAIKNTIGVESFTVLAQVGKGGFGRVHQVVYNKTNEVFAMKTLRKRHLIKTNSVDNTMAEKDILRKVRHPFIVKLHYAFQTDHKLHIVMDFVNGGHLLHHLHREGIFSEHQAKFYLAEVILALEHLHKLNIIHRDLKPENCLLDSSGHCVLTDFGFAKENVKSLDCSSFCGTLEYMAPEVVKKNKYGKSADWWSVGILLYDMLVGHPPFQSKNDHALFKKILNEPLKMPNHITLSCQSLIRGLLQRDLKKRLKLVEIKNHSFFKGMNWVKMLNKEIKPPIVPVTKDGLYDLSHFDVDNVTPVPDLSPGTSPCLSSSQQLQFKGFTYVKTPPAYTTMMMQAQR
eukprot:TRINITY_DN2077_c0_g1_i1.p1 TRINITY_DN2077_c0_g1~~TRINITY_DN2077_c0_g1_i1.p1  ORF type:complete len:435 (+),score=104.41 TRINITY_DN2077_c0_g1_i1:159-1463(+)